MPGVCLPLPDAGRGLSDRLRHVPKRVKGLCAMILFKELLERIVSDWFSMPFPAGLAVRLSLENRVQWTQPWLGTLHIVTLAQHNHKHRGNKVDKRNYRAHAVVLWRVRTNNRVRALKQRALLIVCNDFSTPTANRQPPQLSLSPETVSLSTPSVLSYVYFFVSYSRPSSFKFFAIDSSLPRGTNSPSRSPRFP
ncbi:uncharacterized protein BDV17DRAFT_102616 [Aspergillus undulatus]|uniref:uncharacterized protein n=1 Tax=Aspergillus undulatus TaxID=1810928 RepID=UPI003CCC900B